MARMIPELPDGVTEEDFTQAMAGIISLQGAIDEAMTDLPDSQTLLLAVNYYRELAHSLDMHDPYASDMVQVAMNTVLSMRSVVESMYDDVVLDAEDFINGQTGTTSGPES